MTEILCTLGPASMNDRVITRLEELGVSLFRINLSHTALKDLPGTIRYITERTSIPVCLDTEGAQIRTGEFVDEDIVVRENSIIRVHRRLVPGHPRDFNFYPLAIIDSLRSGDFISIDFNAVLVQVIGFEDQGAVMRVLTGGTIGGNKAVTVERDIDLPALTDKDRQAIAIGRDLGLGHFALSFANASADVETLRAVAGEGAFIIAKIESRRGLDNLEDIARHSDALLIDRGDLSREIPIEQIPRLQKTVIRAAKSLGTKVYVATNLLESMVTRPVPTRAELNDIHNTLLDGADGLVLAAETAIGDHPVECAMMIVKMIQGLDDGEDEGESRFNTEPVSLLVEPHGGRLVQRQATSGEAADAERLATLAVAETVLMDCEQIADGAYSPLSGFMGREELDSVLAEMRLPGGVPWTLPVVLQPGAEAAARIGAGERLGLTGGDGQLYAVLDVSEVYAVDLEEIAGKWFATASPDHPGVARLFAGGKHMVAGEVTRLRRLPSPFRNYELTPAQARFIFAHKGWSKVVGFHTRNPVHRGHEHIQMQALAETGADGLYVNPVIGPKKKGDFLPEPIIKSYQAMLEFGYYPKGRVVLGSFTTYSRYAGPREGVFTALCRKNMGCSHFIVGRDHTGVGDFYPPDATRRLFEDLDDIGITPLFFDAVGYDPKAERYVPMTGGDGLEAISGTRIREALIGGDALPDWIMREVIQEILRGEAAAGRPLFVE